MHEGRGAKIVLAICAHSLNDAKSMHHQPESNKIQLRFVPVSPWTCRKAPVRFQVSALSSSSPFPRSTINIRGSATRGSATGPWRNGDKSPWCRGDISSLRPSFDQPSTSLPPRPHPIIMKSLKSGSLMPVPFTSHHRRNSKRSIGQGIQAHLTLRECKSPKFPKKIINREQGLNSTLAPPLNNPLP
jgi:hypothetical protein